VCGFRLMYLMHENANMDLTDVVVKNWQYPGQYKQMCST
jgi:hypothetical protein